MAGLLNQSVDWCLNSGGNIVHQQQLLCVIGGHGRLAGGGVVTATIYFNTAILTPVKENKKMSILYKILILGITESINFNENSSITNFCLLDDMASKFNFVTPPDKKKTPKFHELGVHLATDLPLDGIEMTLKNI